MIRMHNRIKTPYQCLLKVVQNIEDLLLWSVWHLRCHCKNSHGTSLIEILRQERKGLS